MLPRHGLLSALTSLGLLVGCEASIRTKVNSPMDKCDPASGANVTSADCGAAANEPKGAEFEVTGRTPLVVSPGTKVTLEGRNFRPTMKLAALSLQDSAAANVQVESDVKASFVMPEGDSFGPMDLALTQDGATQRVSVFFTNGQTDHPIMTADVGDVCAGVKFYDATGALREGTRVCSAGAALADCSADGQTDCRAVAAFPAVDKETSLLPSNIKQGVTVAGVAGELSIAGYGDCASDGATGCVATAAFVAVDKTKLMASNLAAGVTIAGVSGAVTPRPADCSADGETGCVANASYTAAATSGLAAKVLNGQTVAGVAGNVTLPPVGDVYTGVQYGVGGTGSTGTLTLPSAANVRTGQGAFGRSGNSVTPTLGDCSSDGATGCVTVAGFKSADMTAAVATNIKSGATIAGVAGNVTPAPANCSSDGATSCVAVAAFKAADMTNVTAGNIKSGVTIAGVAGDFPSATNKLSGASATSDLVSLAATTAADTYEWWGPDGTRYTGTISDAGTITPTTSNQTFNTSVYRQFTVSGDANLVAGKIKSGVSIFGVTGDYPSSTYPLAGADATADLDFATFDAKIKSSASFEWFDSAGARYTNTGDTDIAAGNIADGVTIFGTAGTLAGGSNCTGDGQTGCVTTSRYKSMDTDSSVISVWDVRKGKTAGGLAGELVFYKNMANTTLFDRTSGTGAVTGLDIYDTIDDYNNNGAFPTQNPGGWYQATGTNWLRDSGSDNGAGGGTASDGICNGTEDCVYKDQITGLYWAKDDATTRTWENAITYCDGLTYGGYSDWRLPTQKELQQAYVDGVWSQKTPLNLTTSYYWSSSTYSGITTSAWNVYLFRGSTINTAKTATNYVACVRP